MRTREEDKDRTFFAPAARSDAAGIVREIEAFRPKIEGDPFFDVSPSVLLVLNRNRQIIYANESLLSFLGISKEAKAGIIGKRPGEALDCVNADAGPNGCGTGEPCQSCGAVISIMECVTEGRKSEGECLLDRKTSEGTQSVELRVTATPLTLDGSLYVIFSAVDMRDERRRGYLEGVFLHEIRNGAGNILSLSGLLKDGGGELQLSELNEMIEQASLNLIRDIDGHKMLVEAESRTLKTEPVNFCALQLLERLKKGFEGKRWGEDRTVEISPNSQDVGIFGDPAILERALGNLLRNALEASKPGEAALLSCGPSVVEGNAEFEVRNSLQMQPEVQFHVFQKSFSTKGALRGIGTYMARLLVERYLKGSISFESSKAEGTVFHIEIPTNPSSEGAIS